MIKISKVSMDDKEIVAITRVIRSGNLAQGEVVEQFEKKFTEFIGTKYAIAVCNGTVALYLALLALDIHEGDEIITTPFSFIASTSMILALGAKPVFVDIDESYNIDPNLIEAVITSKTKAILPVHLFGKAADMEKIKNIAKIHNLKILEDACQAHGAISMNKKVGSLGNVGCFSFYATKNMTTGEGGMITTNDKEIADKLKLLRSHGMEKRYIHTMLGFNFRMTNIQAALGLVQLSKLEKNNKKRMRNAKIYSSLLQNIPGLLVPEVTADNSHVFHQYTIRIMKDFPYSRDEVIRLLLKKNIQAGIYYPIPIHKQEMLKNDNYGAFEITETVAGEVLSLPVHPGVEKKDIELISNVLRKFSSTKIAKK